MYLHTIALSCHIFGQQQSEIEQSAEWDFEIYTKDDGLPEDVIMDVFQDKRGILWVVMPYHIARYDGHKFSSFACDLNEQRPHFFAGHYIDDYDRIWLTGRTYGIIVFDTRAEEFIHLSTDENGKAFTFHPIQSACDKFGNIWYQTHEGLVGIQRPANKYLSSEEFVVIQRKSRTYHDEIFHHIDSLKSTNSIAFLRQIKNNADTSETFILTEQSKCILHCTGHQNSTNMFHDFGWLENSIGEIIWDIRKSKRRHAGGLANFVETIDTLTLPAGQYTIHYKTNKYLAFDNWGDYPTPKRKERWGIEILKQESWFKYPSIDTAKTSNYLPLNFIYSIFNTAEGELFATIANEVYKLVLHDENIFNSQFTPVHFDTINLPIESFVTQEGDHMILSHHKGENGKLSTSFGTPIYKNNQLSFQSRWTDSLQHFIDLLGINFSTTRIHFDNQKIIWFDQDPLALHLTNYSGRSLTFNLDYLNLKRPYYITAVHEDNQDNIWIATQGRGLIKLLRPSINIEMIPLPELPVPYDVTFTTISNGFDNHIWIDTRKSGIIKYNLDTKVFTPYSTTGGKNKIISDMSSIFIDSSGKVWLTSEYSIEYLNLGSASFTTAIISDTLLPLVMSESTQGLIANSFDDDSQLYQYYCFDEHNFNLLTLLDNYWRYIPGNQNYFIKEFSGIDRYSQINQSCSTTLLSKILKTRKTDVWSVLEGKDDNIWTGTYDQGVIRYNLGTDSMQYFNMDMGLKSNFVFHCFSDFNNRIWALSDLGINAIDPAQDFKIHRLSQLNAHIKEYNLITDVIYDHRNYFHRDSNEIYILGQEYIHHFNATDALSVSGLAKNVILSIDLQNKDFNKTKISLGSRETSISLAHHQNSPTINYSGVLFNESKQLTFAYRLEGIQDRWANVGNDKSARFINLSPGEYIFHLKTANADGVWNEPTTLKIIIKPPWYWSPISKVIYVLATLWLLYSLYRFLLNRQHEKQEAIRLQQLDELKTQLYTNVTHEFRSPLTVILGMADRLKDYFDLEQESKFEEGRHLIRRNGKRLLDLVNQMLDLSKVDAGHDIVQYKQQDAIQFINYIVESFHSLAYDKGIRLVTNHDDEKLVMDFDEDIIQKILSNLLSNAIKFSHSNHEILIETKSTESSLVIQIKDFGQGISEKDLPHVFDRFYQVDKISRAGTGVGLALTQELVHQINGKIWVESELEQGSTFYISLPITRNAPIATQSPSIAQQRDQTTAVSLSEGIADHPLVLIIEDNKEVAFYIGQCLESQYQLIYAENGQIGIDMAIELTPDFIVSDVMMPLKSGFEVTAELKNDIRTSHIPIILLTAKAGDEAKIEGLKQGADAYLTKPFNKEELLIRVQQLIDLRQTLRQKYSNLSFEDGIQTKDNSPPEAAFILELRNIINDNLTEDLSVTDLCQKIGMSRSQLHRKLTALTEQSTTQFIRMVRFSKSQRIIAKNRFEHS